MGHRSGNFSTAQIDTIDQSVLPGKKASRNNDRIAEYHKNINHSWSEINLIR
jgi:hypothetical protein